MWFLLLIAAAYTAVASVTLGLAAAKQILEDVRKYGWMPADVVGDAILLSAAIAGFVTGAHVVLSGV